MEGGVGAGVQVQVRGVWLEGERLRGEEALSAPFRYRIEARCAPSLALTALLGQPAWLRWQDPSGQRGERAGLVTAVEALTLDSGAPGVGLTVEPRLLCGQSVVQILTELLSAHG